MRNKLLTLEEAREELRVSTITIYRWTKAGILPSVKIGGRRLIPASAIDNIINEATTTNTAEKA